MNIFQLGKLFLIFTVFTASAKAIENSEHIFTKNEVISNEQCTSCHRQSHEDWKKSDHAKSMAVASKSTVLADFNNKRAEHYGQKALFFVENEQYQVTISYDETVDTYPIKYTFGHFPLQQYLVETKKGRLQVLPFAWDSRSKEEGGQRWYHNYSHEEIVPEDRLHWRQPLQNWNGMCADCHSDGLVRNYDVDKNTFDTKFDNINVGCLSCHGDMSAHASAKENKAIESKAKGNVQSPTDKNSRDVAADTLSEEHPTGQWIKQLGEKSASWQGAKRDNSFMEGCFACHALRAPLEDGIDTNKAFLDQFTPQLIATPNYHADGQIKEEVYVYGSFLQSKMFAAGVNCLDCHDKHTYKVKVEGNGLCLQCHDAQAFNVKEHHGHQQDSKGAQCVNCHMPTNRYMGVDDRRDHSFKIPRPHLSNQYQTPNACIGCHQEKDNDWAVKVVNKWHGSPNRLSATELNFVKLQAGESLNLEDHLAIIADSELPVITRATALQLIGSTTQMLSIELLNQYALNKEPLLRLSSAMVANLIPSNERITLLTPLLEDDVKAVRVAAANTLVSDYQLLSKNGPFQKAFEALITANNISSWRGEGHLNQGIVEMSRNNPSEVEKRYKAAIKVDPYMETPYINLADFYRSQERESLVKSVLLKGLRSMPKSGSLHYTFGLHLVRAKALAKATDYFKKSMELDERNPQYLYTYALALDGLGQTRQASEVLKQYYGRYDDKTQLKELGLYFGQKLQDKALYDWFRGN